jgi:hypothetical protein
LPGCKGRLKTDPEFLSKLVISDETWIYRYSAETKQQSSLWESPSFPYTKKARQVCPYVKVFVFYPKLLCITSIFHKDVLELTAYRICWKMCSKATLKLDLGTGFSTMTMNVHALPCLYLNFWLETDDCYFTTHPPPHLVLCNFFLSRKLKMSLKEGSFTYVSIVKTKWCDEGDIVQACSLTAAQGEGAVCVKGVPNFTEHKNFL